MSIDENYKIVIEPPDTSGNFVAFNISCDVLDSDFLMQPVNEADYDSETQACVDRREGKKKSFYEHYVTKRRKKKGVRGCGIESPAPVSEGSSKSSSVGGGSNEKEESRDLIGSSSRVDRPNTEVVKPPSERNVTLPVQDGSFLMAPAHKGLLPGGVGKGALNNAAVRRIACGRMPPTPMPTTTTAMVEQGEEKGPQGLFVVPPPPPPPPLPMEGEPSQ